MSGKHLLTRPWSWVEEHPIKAGLLACLLFLLFPPLFIVVGILYTALLIILVICSGLMRGHDQRPDYDPGFFDD